MCTYETTTAWETTSSQFLVTNPDEMGLLLANMMRYSALLNSCRNGSRPQMEGLTEEIMGIISIRQLLTANPNLLLAYAYPDPDPTKKLVTLIKVGLEVDYNADMEYVKKCVNAHLN